jgi:hypothetical protein
MFARQYTEQLLEMIDEGILDAEHVVRCFTTYLSEDTVKNMMFAEELVPYEDDEDDEDDEDEDTGSLFLYSQEYKDRAERKGY